MNVIRIIYIVVVNLCLFSIQAQTLPEFNNKPCLFDEKTKKLIDLEKSGYQTMAKAKGIFKAEAGFFMDGITSSVKIESQKEIKFIVKVIPGTDPTSLFDLVQFEIKKDKRVFITSKASISKSSNSFEKINYEVKKIKEGYYFLIVKDLAPGEYFFGANDFMYAFSIQ
ncbi:hypothetical protein [Flavobacterium sp.]|uniref:hypothetical protein n=1 Tax=Flavobacterium sp. TaxID=239 RepID=UPI002FDB1535